MNKKIKKSVVDDLFEARCNDFEEGIMKKNKKCNRHLDSVETIFDTILKCVKEEHYKFVEEQLQKALKDIVLFGEYWNKKYYRFGIGDGINIYKDLDKNRLYSFRNRVGFFSNHSVDFDMYMDKYKVNVLYKNNKYNKIRLQIRDLKEKFPRILNFFEEDEIVDFSIEEIETILKIIRLEDELNMMEIREAFKLGMKE